ncbi:MAG: BlaI/MecI/CopY family transcriptional regulator [Sedimentisphaerales bacterium]|nr:BlaI/MecI/CopY family transcriptional regulator [Sedimentisphaerales bacterium]
MTKMIRNSQQGGRRKSNPELSEAEWMIMKVVWENEPCAAGTVQEILQHSKNWAYSTVKGAMDRMVEKGFLKISKIRNLQLFSSTISQEEAQKGEFKKMLKRAFDDALTPMMQFLLESEDFSTNDLKQMRLMIEKAEKSRKSTK